MNNKNSYAGAMPEAHIDVVSKAEGPDLRIQLTRSTVEALLEDGEVELKSSDDVELGEEATEVFNPSREEDEHVRLALSIFDGESEYDSEIKYLAK